MNGDRERELELANKKIAGELNKIHGEILDYITKDLILLQFFDEWFTEAKAKGEDIRHEDKSTALREAQEAFAKVFNSVILVSKVYVNSILDGETKPNIKNLNLLEVNCQEVLENIDAFHKHFPRIIENVAETKENIKFAQEKFIPLVRKFANIYEQQKSLGKENFTWQKIKELWQEVKKINRSEKRLAEIIENQKNNFLLEIAFEAFEIVEEVNKGTDLPSNALPSTHEELNFLQEIADNFPNLLRWAEKKYSKEISENPGKVQELKDKNEQLKSFIQQQRKKLGTSKRPTNKPNPQDQQKIQSQEKEIDYLKQKITELQNQIEELRKKNSASPDSPSDPETKQKIEHLENKKEEIKTQLEKKQSQQKELKDKVEKQTNSPNKQFNWWWVAVPVIILIVVMAIIIAYLMGKKKKE